MRYAGKYVHHTLNQLINILGRKRAFEAIRRISRYWHQKTSCLVCARTKALDVAHTDGLAELSGETLVLAAAQYVAILCALHHRMHDEKVNLEVREATQELVQLLLKEKRGERLGHVQRARLSWLKKEVRELEFR
jgi:hypothetical protein